MTASISSGYLPPVVVSIVGDSKALIAELAADKKLLEEFAALDPQARVGIDQSLLATALNEAKKQIDDLAALDPEARVGVDQPLLATVLGEAKAQIDALAALDPQVHVGIDQAALAAALAQAKAQIDALGATGAGPVVSPAELGAILGAAGAAGAAGAGGAGGADGGAGGVGGALLGGAAGGAAGAAGAGAAAWTAWAHAAHLLTPEIVGLASALVSVAAGFTVLAIAAGPSIVDIKNGVTAVSTAQSAIAAAIPGTSQWATAVGSLGQAWSAIPTILQPAVRALTNFASASAASARTVEIQRWLGAQAGILTKMFSSGAGTFEPLILATQRAIDTIEAMFSHLAGSGALTRLVGSLSKMVGPALVELTQLGLALVNIAAGFAKAVTDGQGLEMLVNLFRSLGQVVNSSLFQGFIAGWVDFDRLISVGLGLVAQAIGLFGRLTGNMQSVGTVIGFVTSGFLAVKAALFLLGQTGAVSATQMASVSTAMAGMMTKVAGIGLLGIGISGLVGNISSLLHVSNPLAGVWHAVAGAFGWVSKAAGNSISTINGYKVELSGAIPVTGQLTQAMDLLVRSEQSIGSSLSNLAQGFAPLKPAALGAATSLTAVTDSVKTLTSNLTQSTASTAQWAADAQILIRRGMNPAAVASLAQQAPQDLASMATATTAQLGHMNVLWQEKMLEASMSGRNGINGMVAKMRQALTNGTPTMKAAAAMLATTLGRTLNVPFNGSIQSVDAIGRALQTLPASVIATLAGKTGQYSAAMNQAAVSTNKAVHPAQSLGKNLLAMIPNLAMVGIGLKLTGLSFTAVAGFASTFGTRIGLIGLKIGGFVTGLGRMIAVTARWAATMVASGARFVAQWVAQLARSVAAGAVWLAEHAVMAAGFIAQNVAMAASAMAAFVVENAATLGLVAVIGVLVAAVIYMATHWKQVWLSMKAVASAVWGWMKGAAVATWGAMKTAATAVWDAMKAAWSAVWDAMRSAAMAVWGAIKAAWGAVLGAIRSVLSADMAVIRGVWTATWGAVRGAAVAVWNALTGAVHAFAGALGAAWNAISTTTRGVWNGIVGFFAGIPGRIVGALGALGSMVANLATQAWDLFLSAVRSVTSNLLGFVRSIPQMILGALGNLGGLLVSAGGQLIGGLIHGITGAVGGLLSTVAGIAGSVLGTVKGVLGIKSPSTEMMAIGVFAAQGMQIGLQNGAVGVLAAARSLGAGAVGAARSSVAPLTMGGVGMAGAAGGGGSVFQPQYHIVVQAPTGNAADISKTLQVALDRHDREIMARLRAGSAYR